MQKRITVIGDKKIITEFKTLCRKQGRFHSVILVGLMESYLIGHTTPQPTLPKVRRGKKA